MKSSVKVVSTDGKIIIPSPSNKEWGAIRVEQTVTEINEQGFMQERKRSSLIKGKIVDLEKLECFEGKEFPGNIVAVESTVKPFDKAEAKRAGEKGEVLTYGGKPIYRQTYLDLSGKKEDKLLKHENAISEADKAAAKSRELMA